VKREGHTARAGGWTRTGQGWTCCVEQGHYGHRARKATWLYAVGVDAGDLPELRWGPSVAERRIEQGFHTAEERRRWQRLGQLSGKLSTTGKRVTDRDRRLTPLAFARLLVDLAAQARVHTRAA
jgi:hypothetical protein